MCRQLEARRTHCSRVTRPPGQNTFFTYRTGTTGTYADGRRERWSPQAYYYVGSFGALAEYVQSDQEVSRQLTTTIKRSGRVDNSAYQLSLAYFLTGEDATFNSITPLDDVPCRQRRLGCVASRGPLQRAEDRQLPPSRAGRSPSPIRPPRPATLARPAVGINWWLNANVKWVLDYELTQFEGGAANNANRPDERALTTRFALTF